MIEDIFSSTLAYVEWEDSTTAQGWRSARDIEELAVGAHEMTCWTVGLLVDESDDRVVISTSLNAQGDAPDPIAIPKRAITRIKKKAVASVFGPARKEAR